MTSVSTWELCGDAAEVEMNSLDHNDAEHSWTSADYVLSAIFQWFITWPNLVRFYRTDKRHLSNNRAYHISIFQASELNNYNTFTFIRML